MRILFTFNYLILIIKGGKSIVNGLMVLGNLSYFDFKLLFLVTLLLIIDL